MAAVILILASDIGHHLLESPGVTLLVILVNKEGVNHLVNQGALNLGQIIIKMPEQLVRQVNLDRLKGLTPSVEGFRKAASFVPAVSGSRGHASVPYNRKVGNLTIEVFVIQLQKHSFDVRSHYPFLLCLIISY
jgi:hypothetical protein